MILLDTVVISELRKKQPSPQVMNWLTGFRDSKLFLSVLSLGKIERCIENKRRDDPAFAALLTRWLEDLLRLYGDRILPVTPAIARRWGSMSAQRWRRFAHCGNGTGSRFAGGDPERAPFRAIGRGRHQSVRLAAASLLRRSLRLSSHQAATGRAIKPPGSTSARR